MFKICPATQSITIKALYSISKVFCIVISAGVLQSEAQVLVAVVLGEGGDARWCWRAGDGAGNPRCRWRCSRRRWRRFRCSISAFSRQTSTSLTVRSFILSFRLAVSALHCTAMVVKYRCLLNLLAGTSCREVVYTCIFILGVSLYLVVTVKFRSYTISLYR